MKINNIIVTADQASYIIDIIESMGDRCDPYLSKVVRSTFNTNSEKLKSDRIQYSIAEIAEEFSIDD